MHKNFLKALENFFTLGIHLEPIRQKVTCSNFSLPLTHTMCASIFVNISDFVTSISVFHYSGKPGESGIVRELFWVLGNSKKGPMNLSLSVLSPLRLFFRSSILSSVWKFFQKKLISFFF